MKAKVFIRNNTTQEVREFEDDFDPKYSDFLWGDGNYACDCNRGLFFAHAGNEPDPPERPCTSELYSVKIMNGNETLYEDDDYDR